MLAVLMMGSTPEEQAEGTENGPSEDGPEEVVKSPDERFQEAWHGADELRQRMHVLEEFAPERSEDPTLESNWERRFRSVRGEIHTEYGDRNATRSSRIDGWMWAAEWAQKLDEQEVAEGFAEEVLELDPNHRKAREMLGWKQWDFPHDDVVERARLDGDWMQDLEQYAGEWMRAERWEEVQEKFEEALAEAKEVFAKWEEDPFLRRAHQMKSSILNDRILQRFADRFELRTIRPFVIIFGTEGGAGDLWLEERYKEFREVLEPFWDMWVGVCRQYGLESKKTNCTLENPQPFAYLSMATEEGFHEYLVEAARSRHPDKPEEEIVPPRGVRAFYKPVNELVYFWEGDGDLEVQTVLHEALHQIMERYTQVHDNMFDYRNAAFVEGAAEYYSAWDRGGPGGSLRFKRWNLESRAGWMEQIREHLNAQEGVIRWNITDDDWVIYQAPALISLCLTLSRFYAGPTLANDLQRSSAYRRNMGAIFFVAQNAFPLMYAYAWAWVYFLNEYYPEEWGRYVENLMNEGMADAEAFLDAFGIDYSEFPNISRLIGDSFVDSWNQSDRQRMLEDRIWERMDWLKENPRIIEVNEQFVDFLGRQLDRGIQSDETHSGGAEPVEEMDSRMRLPWPEEAERRNQGEARQPEFERPQRRHEFRLEIPEPARR